MSTAIAWLVDPWPPEAAPQDSRAERSAVGDAAPGPCPTGVASAGARPPVGRWGVPDQLAIPLSDRGLTLADGLFETVLIEQGRPRLLAEHLRRWHDSAALLAMAPPPAEALLTPRIAEAVMRSGIDSGALRLNWTRGSGGPGSRGLDLPGPDDSQPPHRFWLQLTAWTPLFSPVAVIISPTERRCATSLLSRCKTFAYGPSIQARRQARAAGADDALLLSSDGSLCCATAANLLLQVHGRWLTPPLASGCLPGVMRARALELGLAQEAPLAPELLQGEIASGPALLLNSLGCRPIVRGDRRDRRGLEALEPASAEAFWRALL
jgi:branched-subunit amino acid aminotransferase/4-amino-4-deoxychorismate lyase